MARNGSGAYTAPANSWNPAVAATTIDQDDWNAVLADLEAALTASIASDGQTTTSAAIPFASGISTDTVAEKTGNTGVTIDSVLLKDGRVDTAKGGDIASATTTDIGAATGNYVDVTGTTTITGLGTITAGAQRTVQFDGILTLTHNASSLILPGGANITTAAGDVAGFVSLGSGNWKCVTYTRADGTANVPGLVAADIGVTVQGYDADTVKSDTDATLTAGFAGTDDAEASTYTSGTYTPVYTGGNFKTLVHGAGAFTIGVPAETSTIISLLTNASASGAVTTSGYDTVTGDTIDNTGTNKFILYHTRVGGNTHLHVVADGGNS